ncbi:cell cycle control protein [Plasmodium gonderi]|uniref:Cell cycle control protein n=1 Tax=Plasmodium gonderi TaxID=77519 RepID=A0A1Y1JQG4_PLAGO|nr:cell cycle control protein [Plasmodium gonderi]GAW83758.1 cell cycle control protein [Plasmodium gonderi]
MSKWSINKKKRKGRYSSSEHSNKSIKMRKRKSSCTSSDDSTRKCKGRKRIHERTRSSSHLLEERGRKNDTSHNKTKCEKSKKRTKREVSLDYPEGDRYRSSSKDYSSPRRSTSIRRGGTSIQRKIRASKTNFKKAEKYAYSSNTENSVRNSDSKEGGENNNYVKEKSVKQRNKMGEVNIDSDTHEEVERNAEGRGRKKKAKKEKEAENSHKIYYDKSQRKTKTKMKKEKFKERYKHSSNSSDEENKNVRHVKGRNRSNDRRKEGINLKEKNKSNNKQHRKEEHDKTFLENSTKKRKRHHDSSSSDGMKKIVQSNVGRSNKREIKRSISITSGDMGSETKRKNHRQTKRSNHNETKRNNHNETKRNNHNETKRNSQSETNSTSKNKKRESKDDIVLHAKKKPPGYNTRSRRRRNEPYISSSSKSSYNGEKRKSSSTRHKNHSSLAHSDVLRGHHLFEKESGRNTDIVKMGKERRERGTDDRNSGHIGYNRRRGRKTPNEKNKEKGKCRNEKNVNSLASSSVSSLENSSVSSLANSSVSSLANSSVSSLASSSLSSLASRSVSSLASRSVSSLASRSVSSLASRSVSSSDGKAKSTNEGRRGKRKKGKGLKGDRKDNPHMGSKMGSKMDSEMDSEMDPEVDRNGAPRMNRKTRRRENSEKSFDPFEEDIKGKIEINEDLIEYAKKKIANVTTDDIGRSGGVYIPPFKLERLKKEETDKKSSLYQKQEWMKLKKKINNIVNKVNIDNIGEICYELFECNLIRGKGIFSRAILHAQLSSPAFTNVFSALLCIVNSKFPTIGLLTIQRIIILFRRAYKRNDKILCFNSVKFIAHMINQRILHEIVGLQLCSLLLQNITNDSIQVCTYFLAEVGQLYMNICRRGIDIIFDRLKDIIQEGKINIKTQYDIEKLWNYRKNYFSDFPTVLEDLDLIDEEEKIVHEIDLLDESFENQEELNIFKEVPYEQYEEENLEWKNIANELLHGDGTDHGGKRKPDERTRGENTSLTSQSSGNESGRGENESEQSEHESSYQSSIDSENENRDCRRKKGSNSYCQMGEEGSSSDGGSDGRDGSGEDEGKEEITDMTEQYLINLRKNVYLSIMSSLSFEECVHKLLKLNIKQGYEIEICNMLIDCCCMEKTFQKFYALQAERLCKLKNIYQENFEKCFQNSYNTAHRLETAKLRNCAKLFAHLLYTDAISWSIFTNIKLSEEDTTSSTRIFIKILLQELTNNLGMQTFYHKINHPAISPFMTGLFPTNNAQDVRFCINFFTAIGLGALTSSMRKLLQS